MKCKCWFFGKYLFLVPLLFPEFDLVQLLFLALVPFEISFTHITLTLRRYLCIKCTRFLVGCPEEMLGCASVGLQGEKKPLCNPTVTRALKERTGQSYQVPSCQCSCATRQHVTSCRGRGETRSSPGKGTHVSHSHEKCAMQQQVHLDFSLNNDFAVASLRAQS